MSLACVSWSSMAVELYFCARCSMILIFVFVRPSILSCTNVTPCSTTKFFPHPGKGARSRLESYGWYQMIASHDVLT